MKLACTCSITIDGNEKEVSEIFEIIKKDVNKFVIDYGKDVERNDEYINGELKKIILKTQSEIDKNISCGGIYFLISYEETELLYLGKSQQLKNRLKQHLSECSVSTNSHILDVYKYLVQRKNDNKELKIKYGIINSESNKFNATAEGLLIDYIMQNKEKELFKNCWNVREDW